MNHTVVGIKYDNLEPLEALETNTTSKIQDNDPLYPKLAELICNVSKIVKEARHNDLMYPELAEISTYYELTIWIRNHYRLFYSVFQTDLLSILASIPKHRLHQL